MKTNFIFEDLGRFREVLRKSPSLIQPATDCRWQRKLDIFAHISLLQNVHYDDIIQHKTYNGWMNKIKRAFKYIDWLQ